MIKAENRYLLKTKPVKEAIDIAVGKYGEASLNKICPIEMPRTHTKMIAMLKSVICTKRWPIGGIIYHIKSIDFIIKNAEIVDNQPI